MGALTDERLVAAFQAIPRHTFLPTLTPEELEADRAFFTQTDDEGTSTVGSDQPSQLALLLSLADLQPGQNVLEIGTGTGYSAAITQHVVGRSGHVTSLEINREAFHSAQDNLQRAVMGRVNVVEVDGASGYDARASYDRIISTVAVWDIPQAWVRQLRPGGRIVAPIYADGLQLCGAFTVEADDTLYSAGNHTCAFVPIQGIGEPPPQHLYLGGGSALRIYSNSAARVDSAALHTLLSADAENCHLGVTLTNREYWNGFAPFLMLNPPDGYEFVSYAIEGGKQVYGLSGRGFGLVQQGSAVFVCADEYGQTNCFASSDAFLALAASYDDWVRAGRIGIVQMRVRFVPDGLTVPAIVNGVTLQRHHSKLQLWLENTNQ